MKTANIAITLNLHECPNCGVVFGMTDSMEERRRDDKRSFYCVNGHSLSYPGESQEDKIERLGRELNHAENVSAIRRAELDTEKNAHRRTVGKLGAVSKKLKRVDNGVCPECRRSFANVARHMKSQHT